MKRNRKNLLTGILLAVFLGSTAMFLYQQHAKIQSRDTYREAAEIAGLEAQSTQATETVATTEAAQIATEPVQTEPAATQPQEVNWIPAPITEEDPCLSELTETDLDALRQYNADVIGWIQIPGTKINHPIVQGEDNQHYLKHLWNGSPSPVGAIFLESTNDPAMDAFYSILYGHNLNDGSMFGGLHHYEAQTFYDKYPYVYLVTDSGVFRYEVYAAHTVPVDSLIYAIEIQQEKTKERLISESLTDSEIETGIIPAVTDRILTLSTCDGNYDVRWVVHARLPMIQE